MLVPCPECKRMVSDRAHSCPQCGYPLATLAASSTGRRSIARRLSPDQGPIVGSPRDITDAELERATDEQLDRIASGEDPLTVLALNAAAPSSESERDSERAPARTPKPRLGLGFTAPTLPRSESNSGRPIPVSAPIPANSRSRLGRPAAPRPPSSGSTTPFANEPTKTALPSDVQQSRFDERRPEPSAHATPSLVTERPDSLENPLAQPTAATLGMEEIAVGSHGSSMGLAWAAAGLLSLPFRPTAWAGGVLVYLAFSHSTPAVAVLVLVTGCVWWLATSDVEKAARFGLEASSFSAGVSFLSAAALWLAAALALFLAYG